MTDIDTVTPVYLCLGFYVCAMLLVTFIANRQNSAAEAAGGDASAVSQHFLGGKSFGTITLTLTALASVYSGFTVVGVPNEAGGKGYSTFRWVTIVLSIGISMGLINPRMRQLSIARNYESPGDFIMDRYNSIKVKFGATFCMCAPQILYLGVQFHALVSLILFTTKSSKDMGTFIMWTAVSILLLLLFEAIGGMRSVVYTDSVQSAIMVLVFIAVPFVILIDYGGFGGQIAPGQNVCESAKTWTISANETGMPGYGCINWNNGKIAARKYIADNYFVRTPSTITNMNDLLFWISGLCFAIHPHILQRVLSAKSDKGLKFVAKSVYYSPWIAFPGMILLGMTATARKMTYMKSNQKIPAFFAFLNEWVADDSGFKNFLAYLVILAAIAGIMSTADSSLIGVSNTVSVDLYRGWYNKNATGKQTIYFGKAVSLMTALISGGIAIYLHGEELRTGTKAVVNYANLLTFQNGILWQGFPAFLFGLWTSISQDAIFMGMVSGLAVAFILMTYQAIANTSKDVGTLWYMVHSDFEVLDKAIDPLVGAFVNVCVCLIIYSTQKRKTESEESDTKLTHKKILEYMGGMVEPFTHKRGLYLWLSLSFIILSLVPRIDSVSPDINSPAPGKVMFNGSVNALVLGIPSWVFWQVICTLIATGLGMYGVSQWETVEDENRTLHQEGEGHYELMEDAGLNK